MVELISVCLLIIQVLLTRFFLEKAEGLEVRDGWGWIDLVDVLDSIEDCL